MFKITDNQQYDGYERGLTSMVYKYFDEKSKTRGATIVNAAIKCKITSDQKLGDELPKLKCKSLESFKNLKCIYHLDNI